MKGLRPGWAVKAILVVIFTSMLFRCVSASTTGGDGGGAAATNHSVGGDSGWDLSSNLQAWVSYTTFHVGDSLVFRYTPVHDVLEVKEADYEMCHTVDPVETHNDGETVIALREAGNRYFICGRLSHCAMGLKLHVQVLPALQMNTTTSNMNATSPSPTSSPIITTSPPPNSTTSTSNDGDYDHEHPISNNSSSEGNASTSGYSSSDAHLSVEMAWVQAMATILTALLLIIMHAPQLFIFSLFHYSSAAGAAAFLRFFS